MNGGGQVVEVDWPRLALARLQPGPPPQRARRPARRATRRPPAPGCTPRSPSPSPCSTRPGGSPACTRSRARQEPGDWRAPLVVSAEGLSGRLAKSLGLVRREDRPLGVAVRRYVRTPAVGRRLPRHLLRPHRRRPHRATRCPATAGSSAWATARPTSASACSTPGGADGGDHRAVLRRLAGHLPRRGPSGRRTRSRRCAARACRWRCTASRLHPRAAAHRRRRRHGQPVQRRGHQLRHGDRPHGGRDRGRRARPSGGPGPRGGAARYPERLRAAYGRHHRLGVGFLALLARPDVVRFATAHGLKRPAWSTPRCG